MNRKIIGIIILLVIILFPAYIYFSKKTQLSEPSEIDQIIEKTFQVPTSLKMLSTPPKTLKEMNILFEQNLVKWILIKTTSSI